MGVFHWGCLVSNHKFFEGREQRLQSRLGSVVVSRLVRWIGKYETWFCIWTLAPPTWKSSCHESLQLDWHTSHLVLYCYHLVWMNFKMRSLLAFFRRVGNISAGQARNTSQQAINKTWQGGYSNRQVGKFVGQAGLILPTHGLSVMKSVTIEGESVCALHNLESGIWWITSGSTQDKGFVFHKLSKI